MKSITLKATERSLTGRKVKQLRHEGQLPANVYGKKVKSQSVSVDLKDFEKVYKEAGETGLVELVVGTKKNPVLIHNVQIHPVSEQYLHADFYQVNLKEKVKAQVPVEMIGESPAEKKSEGTAVQYIDEVEVEALPADLVDKFEIDASKLVDLESVITVDDLKVDKEKIKILNDKEQILAKVEPPQEEVVEEPAPETETEEAVSETGQGEQKPSETESQNQDKEPQSE